MPAFDPYNDVGPNGCDGQSDASWRLPLALQILPAIILGVGMIFFPGSPRWLLMKDRDDEALATLAKLRRLPIDDPLLSTEYLEIKASVLLENSFTKENYPGLSGIKLHAAQVCHNPALSRMVEKLILFCSTFPSLVLGQSLKDSGLVALLCSSSNLWVAMVSGLEKPLSLRQSMKYFSANLHLSSSDLLRTNDLQPTWTQW